MGNFTMMSDGVVQTTACPSQVYTQDGPPPPSSSSVQWTAPAGTTAATVEFDIAWGLGQVSPSGSFQGYVKTTNVAIKLASPRPLAQA